MATLWLPILACFVAQSAAWNVGDNTRISPLYRSFCLDYLSESIPPRMATVLVCASEVGARAGRMSLVPPGIQYDASNANKYIDIRLQLNRSSSCMIPSTNFAFFLTVRPIQLKNGKPAFDLAIAGMKVSTTSTQSPSADSKPTIQYLSPFTQRPRLDIDLELSQSQYDASEHPVQIDYLLVAQSGGEGDEVQHCRTLNGYVPTEVYCQEKSSDFIACPAPCTKADSPLPAAFPPSSSSPARLFDRQGFSYVNCGAERNGTLCGEVEHVGEAGMLTGVRPKPNWILDSTPFYAILGSAIALFVGGPIVIFCLAWRQKTAR